MVLGRKGILISISGVSLLMAFAFLLYKPLTKMEVESSHDDLYMTVQRTGKNDTNSYCETLIGKVKSSSFRKLDLQQSEIPTDIEKEAASIEIMSNVIKIDDIMVDYRTAKMKNKAKTLSVLLLHGKAYSSKTWETLHTLQYITAFGLRAIAVDLPTKIFINQEALNEKGAFLQKLITTLNLTRPIIISPSMSGSYSIPHLIAHWQNISGFVSISPTGTGLLRRVNCGGRNEYNLDSTCHSWEKRSQIDQFPDLSCMKVPVLVIAGEEDNVLSSARLCRLPWSKGIEIADGGHAAYLSNPQLWHKILYNFLLLMNAAYVCE